MVIVGGAAAVFYSGTDTLVLNVPATKEGKGKPKPSPQLPRPVEPLNLDWFRL
jgi:hypothetical protein